MRVRALNLLLLPPALGLAASLCAAEPATETATETAASGLIARILPKQACQFTVETIPTDAGRDVFEIESRAGKIALRGNNGVAIASALNWYLLQDCHCD